MGPDGLCGGVAERARLRGSTLQGLAVPVRGRAGDWPGQVRTGQGGLHVERLWAGPRGLVMMGCHTGAVFLRGARWLKLCWFIIQGLSHWPPPPGSLLLLHPSGRMGFPSLEASVLWPPSPPSFQPACCGHLLGDFVLGVTPWSLKSAPSQKGPSLSPQLCGYGGDAVTAQEKKRVEYEVFDTQRSPRAPAPREQAWVPPMQPGPELVGCDR